MALIPNARRSLFKLATDFARVNAGSVRFRSRLPLNTVVLFVPQQEAWVVERMGRYNRILDPGLNLLIPIVDQIKYVQSLKELAIEIPQQSAITVDNVALQIDGVLYLRVIDPYMASYGVEDPQYAITQLAQTTMRSEVGKITLDTVFRERESLNVNIVAALNKAAEPWGMTCMRYEIRDMKMPPRIEAAMHLQVEAERKKRASVLESEGVKAAKINVAEGHKMETILNSEAKKQEQINRAEGEASAIKVTAEARAKAISTVATGEANAVAVKAEAQSRAINMVSKALEAQNGRNAAALSIAEKYVGAFGNLAKSTNTVIVPANTGDAAGMVAQALGIYSSLSSPKSGHSSTLPAGQHKPNFFTPIDREDESPSNKSRNTDDGDSDEQLDKP